MEIETLTREKLVELIVDLQRQNQYLQFELDQIKRAVFGSKSERFIPDQSPHQSRLFDDTKPERQEPAREADLVTVEKVKKKKPVRGRLPIHLRREELVVEPEIDTEEMTALGQEVSEKLEIKPAEIYVRRTVRPKYLDNNGKIHIAELNEPFPRCQAGASLIAHVATQKYLDHVPLYRQSKIFKRQDIDLPRSSLNGMIAQGMKKLDLIYKALQKELKSTDYIQADESSIPVLTKDNPGSTLKGCMLVKVAPEKKLVEFDYIKTKEKSSILTSLKDFNGYLQVDGNVTYETKGAEDEVTLLHCLVHSRRKFEQALEYDKILSSHVLTEIKKLYLIERQIAPEASLDQIRSIRQEKSLPILTSLHTWLEKYRDVHPPSTPFYKATRYMLKRWDGLIKYTTHGKLRPDNNLIENQIRPLALGRKNYMFAGSHEGAKYAATFYSLFATCKLNGLDPHRWLTDVYQRINDHPVNKINELLPLEEYQFSV